eukprot:2584985-Alexandrium_andersonii.AAC.1
MVFLLAGLAGLVGCLARRRNKFGVGDRHFRGTRTRTASRTPQGHNIQRGQASQLPPQRPELLCAHDWEIVDA